MSLPPQTRFYSTAERRLGSTLPECTEFDNHYELGARLRPRNLPRSPHKGRMCFFSVGSIEPVGLGKNSTRYRRGRVCLSPQTRRPLLSSSSTNSLARVEDLMLNLLNSPYLHKRTIQIIYILYVRNLGAYTRVIAKNCPALLTIRCAGIGMSNNSPSLVQ